MTTKDYLAQLLYIDTRIADKMRESKRWRDIALGSRSGGSDTGDRVQTSKRYDKMGDAITNAVMYETESIELANMLSEKKHRIITQIDSIRDMTAYSFLKGYYVMRKPISVIGEECGYSRSHSYKLFDSAILMFESEFGSTYM